MTTHDQFVYYKNFAYEVFDYLKGISKFIPCILEVDYCDTVGYTFANIRRPNIINLHIDNIVCECGNGYNKNKICSMIIIAITHELFHVEQLMSQELYRSDKNYHNSIESAVEKKTLMYLVDHAFYINSRFQMELDLSYFDIHNMGNGNYVACTNAEQIYKYTIMNVIFRRDYSYKEFEMNVLDKYKSIAIVFENGANFLIKSNGEFCDSTLSIFIQSVGAEAGKYDRYTVNVNVVAGPYREQEDVAIVTFTLSNRQIYPMVFRN